MTVLSTLLITPVLGITPATIAWTPKVGLVMVIANVIAIAIGKATIQHQNEGLALPNNKFFGGFGHGAMLGCTSFGHILGLGAIQGLAASGVL